MTKAIGIDLGGSGFRIAVVDGKLGTILGNVSRFDHTDAHSKQSILHHIRQALNEFPPELPLGIGFPGMTEGNRILTAPNLGTDWHGIDIANEFGTKRAISLLNDADAAAICEQHVGSGKDSEGTLLMVTIGTGLGTGVVVNGELQPHRDLGLLRFPDRPKALEYYASARAKRFHDLDYETWAKELNVALEQFVQITDADYVVLSGAICHEFEKFYRFLNIGVPLRKARNIDTAGIIGAALHSIGQQKKRDV